MGQRIPRILLLLIIGAMAIGYVYIAYPLSIESTKNAVNDLVEVARDRRRLMRFSSLPEGTVQILMAHDPNANNLTDAEEGVLLEAFHVYDTNVDGMWSFPEFEVFIEDIIEPGKRFDVMDLDDNGVLTSKEIILTMSAFDSTDIFACADSDQVLLDVFGYDTSPRDNLYYEYLAHLWIYELDQLGIDIISRAEYVKYIKGAEAFYHGYDDDSLVSFDEFKDEFFDSLLYQSFMNSMKIEPSLAGDAYAQLDAIDDAAIAALELTTSHASVKPTIEAYMDGRTFSAATGYSPTRSLLYAFPMNDVLGRRRMTVSMADIDMSQYTADQISFFMWWRTCKITCGGQTDYFGYHKGCDVDNCGPDHELRYKKGHYCVCWTPSRDDVCYALYSQSYKGHSGVMHWAMDRNSPHIAWDENDDYTCSCFGEESVVKVLVDGVAQEKKMRDVSAGDYVFDGTEYSKVIAVERSEEKVQMIKVHLNDNSELTMTANHLLYNAQSELMQAGKLKIGDKLLNDLVVVDVEFGLYESPLNALTMSGKIEVNGVLASCYVFSADFAAATHRVMAPFRFLSEYVSEYYTAKVVEATTFGTARAINLGGQIGANLGLPAFINVFIIILLVPVVFVKQFFVFCFSQYSVMEFGHLMSQYISL